MSDLCKCGHSDNVHEFYSGRCKNLQFCGCTKFDPSAPRSEEFTEEEVEEMERWISEFYSDAFGGRVFKTGELAKALLHKIGEAKDKQIRLFNSEKLNYQQTAFQLAEKNTDLEEQLQSERERADGLRGALVNYGTHLEHCIHYSNREETGCSCGFNEAIEKYGRK